MWNLGNEHGQYIISVTFIASTTKKTELVSSDTKNVHFRIGAVQKALLMVTIIKSTFQGYLNAMPYRSTRCTFQVLMCLILGKCHIF